jgi:DNA topoisomerase-1
MSKNLVIVESPAKAKTISKYLGKDFDVLASYGHVRDLVPKEGAVDPEHGFAMKYQVIDRNEKHVNAIIRALKKADALYLATDPDREGEAISWHLIELLKEKNALDDKDVHRVIFHEITKNAVRDAIEHPRGLSDDLVGAQQARRALDYLVGFNLSPLLWKKVQRGLSAGRVQSPALRMIVERELEIEAFKAREYWSIEADLSKDEQPFVSRLVSYRGEKVEQFSFENEAAARDVERTLLDAANGELTAASVTKKQRRRNPAAPFTTSTLQQEASRKLGFNTQRTMRVAQKLYEGIEVPGEGNVGLITYMRTDSVALAQVAVEEIRDTIADRYGKDNVPDAPREFKTKSKNAQEAHEAIRPTSVARAPDEIRGSLDEDQFKLYSLIWRRTMACQMIPAVFDTVAIDFAAGNPDAGHRLRANGSVLVVPGFIAVYQEGKDDATTDD